MKEKGGNKLCCYLYGLIDLVCFVGGTYLLSVAIFGGCCATACNCGVLGLPLIVLGCVIRNWTGRGCCCCSGTKSCCVTSKDEVETTE